MPDELFPLIAELAGAVAATILPFIMRACVAGVDELHITKDHCVRFAQAIDEDGNGEISRVL